MTTSSKSLVGPGRFQWNAGGWFGSPLGGSAWVIVTACFLVFQNQSTLALVPAVCFAIVPFVSLLLWARRDRIYPFPALMALLGLLASAVLAQSTEQLDDGHLCRVEQRIRTALAAIEDELSFEYRKSLPNTLVVNYRTRTFMVHGSSKRGEYAEKAHETVGPSYIGFRLRLTLEEAGFINAAGVPQTFRQPYWTTYLDTRLLEGTDMQVFCGLSYGRQVDQELLKQLRKVITDLGDAPYLKRRRHNEDCLRVSSTNQSLAFGIARRHSAQDG